MPFRPWDIPVQVEMQSHSEALRSVQCAGGKGSQLNVSRPLNFGNAGNGAFGKGRKYPWC
jgi:hypothetical protein